MNFESFPWPTLGGDGPAPVCDGNQFLVGLKQSKILIYSQTDRAWSADLTQMHEREASSSHPITLSESGPSQGFKSPDSRLKISRAKALARSSGCGLSFRGTGVDALCSINDKPRAAPDFFINPANIFS